MPAHRVTHRSVARSIPALAMVGLVFALSTTACVTPVSEVLSQADQALAEGRYSEAVALLRPLAAEYPDETDIVQRLEQARLLADGEEAFLDAEAALAEEDYSRAGKLLERIGPEHPRYTEAQELLSAARTAEAQAEASRWLDFFSDRWALPLDRETATFRLDGPDGAALFVTLGVGELGDEGFPVRLVHVDPVGVSSQLASELFLCPEDRFPVAFLADGRLVVGTALWAPPAEPEPLELPGRGLLLGWDVNPSGTLMAVTTMVSHGVDAPNTFDTIIVDLVTMEAQVIDSYDPDWVGGWMGELIELQWLDDSTVRFERLLTREPEHATWTAP